MLGYAPPACDGTLSHLAATSVSLCVTRRAALSDHEALRRLGRDPDAICVLYDRHVARLVAALVARSGDRELAFEIVQETFARALEHGHRVRIGRDGSAWPWLWRVAQNLLADHRRRGAVDASARTRLGIVSPAFTAEAVDELIARLDAAAIADPLGRALDGLPDAHREALLGRVVDEQGYGELAAAASVSEQLVRARVSRGLRAMLISAEAATAGGLETTGLERRTLELRGRKQSVGAWVARART